MRRLLLVPFLCTAVVRTEAIAQHWYGAGVNSCGQWTEDRQRNNYFTSGQRILGFISAANYYLPQKFAETDSKSLLFWVDNYCRQTPVDPVRDAGVELVKAVGTK